jgi:hypothetical protein
MWRPCLFLGVVSTLTLSSTPVTGQQYDDYDQGYSQDYTQDSLYHDYAMKQQVKDAGKG